MLHNIISKMCLSEKEKETKTETETKKQKSEPFMESTNIFRIPIYYNKQKCKISQEVSTELEIENVYEVFCPTTNSHEVSVLKDLSETYTTDVKYLQDTQDFITKYKAQSTEVLTMFGGDEKRINHYETVIELEKELQIDQFLSKYGLIDYEHFEFLNNIENVLQVLTLYVIISPFLTLLTPLIIIIVPFFILQIRYSELSWELYLTVLKDIGKSNPLIRMITHYGESTAEQKTYQVLTFSFYVFSIYQQITYCYRFYENFKNIHRYLVGLRTYLEKTIQNMRHIISFTHELKTYKLFNTDLCKNINELMDVVHLLSPITPFELSVSKFLQMGYVLKTFYTIQKKSEIMENVTYALHFNSYFRHMETVASLYGSGKIYTAKLLKDKTPTVQLKDMYYPALISDKTYSSVVKNNVSLNKNIIITGPNASGKTTTIKAVFLNVLLTQQFGMGCYSGASITPFKHLHCYINIPDTMGRDSLFQAEARRCKKIIDEISQNSSGKHLCLFDEPFSGTNPEEAIESSKRFIQYITKEPNVKWVLTTHFNKLCKSLNKHKQIQNCHMDVSENLVATYKLKKNISNVKGALKILSDMDFPKEIIHNSFC
jgi:hypothetical protein